ncbi:MAG: ArsR/SmtB family transcription factor [Rhodothermaceae bacterium]
MKKEIKIFKALGDSNRFRIIKMLEQRSLCVCEITEALELAPSTVSKHLSILKEAELIDDLKKGKWVYYKLCKEVKFAADILKLVKTKIPNDEIIEKDIEFINSEEIKKFCEIKIKEKK